MELKLKNGRYVALGNDADTVSGAQELAQRIAMKLTSRRGKFWPLPDYGSRLYTLLYAVKAQDRETAVRDFVAEAIADEAGVSLRDFTLSVEGDTLLLSLDFAYTGGGFTVNTAIREEI